MLQTIVQQAPESIEMLLERSHPHSANSLAGELLSFDVDPEHDVYNPTSPFNHNGEELLAARVEPRGSEQSTVQFFRPTNNERTRWTPAEDLPSLPLQDPFVVRIHEQWVVGGVFTYSGSGGHIYSWETHLYSGPSPAEIALVAIGPKGMKDIRPIELPNGNIGVFTRPQGSEFGRGQVGYTEVSKISQIDDSLMTAPIVSGFIDTEAGEWGGVNQAHALPDGRILALGHLARFDAYDQKHYLPVTFNFDPSNFEVSRQQIPACRDCFPETPAKRPELSNVVFPGGLELLGSRAILYAGLNDTSAARTNIGV